MKKDTQQENTEVVSKKTQKSISGGLETEIYNQKGQLVGKLDLPESIFGLPWNGDLVHQVIVGMQANARTPVAHTKTRGEVRGGGKKPWRQKGTGRARHGSSRSPIWSGGGVTHGPRNDKDYSQKINKKMKAKALYTVLSEKLRKGQLIFVEELSLKGIKTKDANSIIKDLSLISGFEKIFGGKKRNTYITVPAKDENLKKSFSNLKTVKLDEVRNLNPVDLFNHKHVIISFPTESIAFLGGKTEKSSK